MKPSVTVGVGVGVPSGADCGRDRCRAAEAGRNGDVGVLDRRADPIDVMRTRRVAATTVLKDGCRDGIAARINEGDGGGQGW